MALTHHIRGSHRFPFCNRHHGELETNIIGGNSKNTIVHVVKLRNFMRHQNGFLFISVSPSVASDLNADVKLVCIYSPSFYTAWMIHWRWWDRFRILSIVLLDVISKRVTWIIQWSKGWLTVYQALLLKYFSQFFPSSASLTLHPTTHISHTRFNN